MRRALLAFAFAFALVLVLVGCGRESLIVTRAEYGDRWPLTVSQAELKCFATGELIAVINDLPYALNGTARARYNPIDPYWRDDPRNPGAKVPITPLIQRAQDDCL